MLLDTIAKLPERVAAFATGSRVHVGPPLSKAQLKAVAARAPALLPVYEHCNGFTTHWYALRVPHLVGRISVPTWTEVTRMMRSENHPFAAQTKRGWIPFDLDGADFGTLIDPSGTTPRLFRVYPSLEVELPLSVDGYLERALSVFGMFSWQDHLDRTNPVHARASYNGFFEEVLGLFGAATAKHFVKPSHATRLELPSRLPTLEIPAAASRTQFRFDGSVETSVIRLAELGSGTPFPRELVDFYLRTGRVEVTWKLGKRTTSFAILTPQQAFNRESETAPRTWDVSYGARIGSKDPEFADKYLLIAKENDVLFRITDGKVQLFYREASGEVQPIHLSFRAYVAKMFRVGGYEDWEVLFLDEALNPKLPKVADCLDGLRACFPDLDLEAFCVRAG